MRELLELLEHDGRRSIKELATMLGRSEYEIEEQMKKLEKEKIILGYNTMIDWEKYGDDSVSAMIEVNVTPQREFGFDAIAERIYRFDEVKTVYLMLVVFLQSKALLLHAVILCSNLIKKMVLSLMIKKLTIDWWYHHD